MKWGSSVEKEVRNRIKVSLYAYAYEYENESLVSDEKYDALCLSINTEISTGNRELDNFFSKEFTPETGMWVHKHPDKKGLKNLYNRIKKRNKHVRPPTGLLEMDP